MTVATGLYPIGRRPRDVFDLPADLPVLWIALSAVSLSALGLAVDLPTTRAPDPTPAVETVDAIAAGSHPGTAEHPIAADAVRVGPRALALRSSDRVTRSTYVFGPVTPATDGPLRAVLRGASPATRFDGPTDLRAAARAARDRSPTWRRTDRVLIRRLQWEGVDVTLVG
ncbi:hypothetical protein BRD17_00425 [Halobacteriales archaeon SW_7_68_16]|nr:MAG: hypothetical protein BRD17_00425 [Halobacteriales archaeon SW_7_68_16]